MAPLFLCIYIHTTTNTDHVVCLESPSISNLFVFVSFCVERKCLVGLGFKVWSCCIAPEMCFSLRTILPLVV
ncbi:hypothetical protein BDU57DRAFT_515636 [Ampelomyces quisqualis]|uniref:Uncharacterized protein n=1 Tax=Ampelomyces quisqualis TaxID=50730 RepID=A0A6A5QKB8_AMPQU|nr:hypothetical protein BDU57DRAFT_515636 [Ampelomyces quisqualis]